MMQDHRELGRSPRRWWVLGALVLSLLVVQIDTTILGVAVERLSRPAPEGLGLSQGELLWTINSYTLTLGGGVLTAGTLADRFGRKRVLLIGMVLFGAASAWCAFASSGPMLIAGRVALGIAAAMVTPSTLAIISHTFRPEERPRAIGIWSGGIGVAVALGPIIGGLLLDHLWWGAIFLVNVPVVVLAVAVMAWIVPESRNPSPGRVDLCGIVLSICGMVLLVDGVITGGDTGDWASPRVWAVSLSGIIVVAGFVWWQRRAASPLIDVAWFRKREFSGAILVMSLTFFAMLGATFTLTFYLLALRHFSVLATGALMLPLAVSQLVLSSQTPRLTARWGARTTAAIGMGALTVALLVFAGLGAVSPLWQVEIALFLLGVGLAFVMPSASASVMGSVPRERSGAASATGNAFRQVGGALGTAVLAAVLAGVYRVQMTPNLGAMPDSLRETAAGSIQATQGVLARLGESVDAGPIIAASNAAFVSGFHAAAIVGAAITFVGDAIAFFALPAKRRKAPTPASGDAQVSSAEAMTTEATRLASS